MPVRSARAALGSDRLDSTHSKAVRIRFEKKTGVFGTNDDFAEVEAKKFSLSIAPQAFEESLSSLFPGSPCDRP